MKRIIMGVICIIYCASFAFAQEEVIFTGIPEIKISEGGTSSVL